MTTITDEQIITLAADHHMPVRFPHEVIAFARALLATQAATNAAAKLTDEQIEAQWKNSTTVGGDTTQQFVRHFAHSIESAVLASLVPAGLETLTRYRSDDVHPGWMHEANDGRWMLFADVERWAASHAGAAAEPAIPADVRAALDRMCLPLDESRLSGVTAREDARCMAIIKRHIEAAAPSSADVRAAGWVSVEDRLPGKECLAVYVTPSGKQRLIRAKYARQFQIEAQGDDCETEYNDADDTFYIKAGWLECIDNWGEYSSCYVTEGTVTHWMPLPAAPATGQSEGGEG